MVTKNHGKYRKRYFNCKFCGFYVKFHVVYTGVPSKKRNLYAQMEKENHLPDPMVGGSQPAGS